MFADYYGVPEDPATGSANGCLAAYLTHHRYFGTDRIDIRVEQGQNLAALKQVKVDRRCLTLLADAQAKALLVFSPETYQRRNDLSVRVFADYYGVPEDPATGSANGCLAAYLTRHRT